MNFNAKECRRDETLAVAPEWNLVEHLKWRLKKPEPSGHMVHWKRTDQVTGHKRKNCIAAGGPLRIVGWRLDQRNAIQQSLFCKVHKIIWPKWLTEEKNPELPIWLTCSSLFYPVLHQQPNQSWQPRLLSTKHCTIPRNARRSCAYPVWLYASASVAPWDPKLKKII